MNFGLKTMLAGLISVIAITPSVAAPKSKNVTFEMVRNPKLPSTCIPKASATVTIVPGGPVETMTVTLSGLPPNTDFDFFVIQVPNGPFGMSWYQGDIETNRRGQGHQNFIGRFSEETFVVAPGVANAPIDNDADQTDFPNAINNPKTNPIQMYHLGLWFNDPQDAVKAGCPGTKTPFNGTHNAGVQALNTSNFPDDSGPLSEVK
jgi:hypothetical protein